MKVTIEIIDKLNGRVELRCTPTAKEIANSVANLGVESNAYGCALFVLKSIHHEAKQRRLAL